MQISKQFQKRNTHKPHQYTHTQSACCTFSLRLSEGGFLVLKPKQAALMKSTRSKRDMNDENDESHE